MSKSLLLSAILAVFVLGGVLQAQETKKDPASPPTAGADAKKIDKEVVFDGDQKGSNAKGWAVPDGKATIKVQDKEVRTPSKKTVEFHAEGSEWLGGGWNWFSWTPADGGTDISKHKNVSFWAKVTGQQKPTELQFALGASDKTATETADLLEYCPDLMDGKWHEVVVPIKDLNVKNVLNKAKVWEIHFGTWSNEERKFSLFIDEIGFDSREVKRPR